MPGTAMTETAWIAASIVLGLLVGSFLNVVIHRLPLMLDAADDDALSALDARAEASRPPAPASLSLAYPGSHCPDCGHRIRAIENIPVLSYCFLRGVCAACGQAISARYPLVELLGAAGALACMLSLGPTHQGFAALIFTWIAIAIAFIDLDHLMVPDVLSISLLWFGLIVNAFGIFTEPSAAIIGAVSGYLAFWTVNALAARMLGRTAIGQGDFKLFAAIGAWLGWQALAPALLIASASGAVIGYALIWTGRMNRGHPVCFAPFLMIGALSVMLSDGKLTVWLWTLFGP
jgi:leader peptidase (prepilin peptidase) / N-methyltransferase